MILSYNKYKNKINYVIHIIIKLKNIKEINNLENILLIKIDTR